MVKSIKIRWRIRTWNNQSKHSLLTFDRAYMPQIKVCKFALYLWWKTGIMGQKNTTGYLWPHRVTHGSGGLDLRGDDLAEDPCWCHPSVTVGNPRTLDLGWLQEFKGHAWQDLTHFSYQNKWKDNSMPPRLDRNYKIIFTFFGPQNV